MEFSSPAFLFALPLALAPLILHLFYRRRRSTVLFSSLNFFLRQEKYFAYRRRLLEIFLMLCRILGVALIVLALAGPYFRKITFLANGGTEAVIVLDDSMSMQRTVPGGHTAFELAVRQAEGLLNVLNREDSAGLVFLSGRPGMELTREKQKVVSALRGAKVTGSAGNLTSAVRQAVELLKGTQGINREIYLLTDLQESMLPKRKIRLSDWKNGHLFVIPISGSNANASISGGPPDPSLKTPGSSVYLPFTIRNSSPRSRTFKATLNITGNPVQSKTISVKADSSVNEHFIYVPVRPGCVDGTITIDDPDIPLDNTLPFSFSVSDLMNVLLLSGGEGVDPFYYLRLAVEPTPRAYGIKFDSASFRTTGIGDWKRYSLIFLSPGSAVHTDTADRLLEYLRSGGTVAALPETDGSTRFYSVLAERSRGLLPAIYGPVGETTATGILFDGALASLNDLLQLNLLRWRKLAGLQVRSATVLARSGFRPVISEYPCGSGRVIALAFDLRRRFSNWPELKSFPVVMNALVNYAAGRKNRTIALSCGGTVRVEEKTITYTDSRGTSGPIPDGIFRETLFPGIVFFSGGPYEAAVLTPPPRESLLHGVPLAEMKRCFDSPVTLLSPGEEPELQIARLRRGTDLSGAALLAALILLTVEFLLGSGLSGFFRKQEGTEKGGPSHAI